MYDLKVTSAFAPPNESANHIFVEMCMRQLLWVVKRHVVVLLDREMVANAFGWECLFAFLVQKKKPHSTWIGHGVVFQFPSHSQITCFSWQLFISLFSSPFPSHSNHLSVSVLLSLSLQLQNNRHFLFVECLCCTTYSSSFILYDLLLLNVMCT